MKKAQHTGSLCSIRIMLFTANSNQSKWVPREIERGVNYGKIILPFKIENTEQIQEEIKHYTQNHSWVDAATSSFETGLNDLVKVVKKLVGKNNDDCK